MGQIFISYRHVDPDERLARALLDALEARGHPVFIDARIEVGTRWVAEIERQIRASAYFVVVLSEHSIHSDMVRQEVALAHELEQDDRMRILPIRACFDGVLPYDLAAYLNPIQYATWRPGEPFDEICGQIVAAVEKGSPLPLMALPNTAPDSGRVAQREENPDVVMESGTVPLSSRFYVPRRADQQMVQALGRPGGDTLIVKGAWQTGKSSLLVRAQSLLVRGVYIDFQQRLEERAFENLDSLLLNLANWIASDLGTEVKPKEIWDEDLGAKESFADFLEIAVLRRNSEPVVLCLDEVDRVFGRPYQTDFFAAVRGWNNKRATSPTWNRLHLVIAHFTDPALWIDDINQSPFNVGQRLVLDHFTATETLDLAARYDNALARPKIIDELRHLVGGQPYLLRQALYEIHNGTSLEELQRQAPNEDGPFEPHLAQMRSLLQRGRFEQAIRSIIEQEKCPDRTAFHHLHAVGLVRRAAPDRVRFRCKVYKLYLQNYL